MAVQTILIDPVTRIEGHLKIDVKVDTVNGVPKVVDAFATGTLFRGFEALLVNRPPEDSQHITQRICGVCPVPHGMAAVMALDSACGVTIPPNARIMRNLVMGANFIQSHILHFYHLSLPDYVNGPEMPPWQPSWPKEKQLDANYFNGNYIKALEMTRKAHEMGALFGGRMPHPPTYIPGGFTTTPRADRISKFRTYLGELLSFIQTVYLKDVNTVAGTYGEYKQIGQGPGNLLAFGAFDLDAAGNSKLLKRGLVTRGSVQSVDLNKITEQVKYSWYADNTNGLRPVSGKTTPNYPKANAYSWLKAPRYDGAPCEAGPLARMWVNGDYQRGISVMDRHLARAEETLKIGKAMQGWIDQLAQGAGGPVYTRCSMPTSASSYGLTEAPRGALGHWLQITNRKIGSYQVITPTCWNSSPRDSAGKRGPIEEALIGTPVANIDQPKEVVRVIHSFDPCLSCAVHVMRPAQGGKIFALGHVHGPDRSRAPIREEHLHPEADKGSPLEI